jgi:hypothetical protein
LDESWHFIEWTAQDVDPEIRPDLTRLQGHLARWQRQLEAIVTHADRKGELVSQARQWSNRLLEWSGLLNAPEPAPTHPR